MRVLGATDDAIGEAAAALRRGELVAFPTETVYGLGARADRPDAVRQIFEAKGRPADHPLIVHLADPGDAVHWARDVPPAAARLADAFWPGPLTLILPVADGVDRTVTGGQDTIGLRVPAHPVARRLLRAAGVAVAAPSANRFGRISPTTAEHVASELGDVVARVVDGGPCERGLESTIVDLSGDAPCILRPGPIGRGALEAVLGHLGRRAGDDGPRAPGTLAAHYAPRTPVSLVSTSAFRHAVEVEVARGTPVVALVCRIEPWSAAGVRWLRMPQDVEAYGRALYARLHEADSQRVERVFIEQPPSDSAWAAVNDRLARAAVGSRSGPTDPER